MPSCPTCGKKLDSSTGVSVHHKHVHGSSIAREESTCSNCGDGFYYYPSKSDGVFCSTECNDNIPESSRSRGERYNSVKVTCDNCGDTIVKQQSKLSDHNFCDKRCYGEWKSIFSDEDDPYSHGWKRVRKKALSRDKNTCQYCGCSSENNIIDVHHDIPVRIFDDHSSAHNVENLTCLCRSCHIFVENHLRSISNDKMTKRLK